MFFLRLDFRAGPSRTCAWPNNLVTRRKYFSNWNQIYLPASDSSSVRCRSRGGSAASCNSFSSFRIHYEVPAKQIQNKRGRTSARRKWRRRPRRQNKMAAPSEKSHDKWFRSFYDSFFISGMKWAKAEPSQKTGAWPCDWLMVMCTKHKHTHTHTHTPSLYPLHKQTLFFVFFFSLSFLFLSWLAMINELWQRHTAEAFPVLPPLAAIPTPTQTHTPYRDMPRPRPRPRHRCERPRRGAVAGSWFLSAIARWPNQIESNQINNYFLKWRRSQEVGADSRPPWLIGCLAIN